MTDIDDRARRRSSTLKASIASRNQNQEDGTGHAMESDAGPVSTSPSSKGDDDIAGLTGALSALKFLPPSVRFGRGGGRGRGGFSRT